MKRKHKALRLLQRNNKKIIIVSICLSSVAFGVLGVVLWQASQAATPTVAAEAELGTVIGSAANISDSMASGGSAIKFGSGTVTSPSPTPSPLPPPPPTSGTFVHPGVLVSRGQLDYVKSKIAAGQEPWKSALAATKANAHASLSVTPKPRATVQCGANDSPNYGCKDEIFDSVAAYTDALIWSYTGDTAYAKKSIQIMNAWSSTLKSHTDYNAPLQAGWTGAMFSKAADIMRTSPDWAPTDVARYKTLMTSVYLRDVTSSQAVSAFSGNNGNWDLAGIDARIGIGVFTDNRNVFDSAITSWKSRAKKYIYITSDSSVPSKFGTSSPKNGQIQETCRDLQHTGMGMASLVNTAETAYIQGVDVYTAEQTRIVAGLEFSTGLLVNGGYNSSLCGGSSVPSPTKTPTYTIGWNHYGSRKGLSLPNSKKYADSWLPGGTGEGRTYAWETLTHYNTGPARIGN